MSKRGSPNRTSLVSSAAHIRAAIREKIGFPEMILLDTVDSEFGPIEVFQERLKGSLIYKQGGCYQSEADWYGTSLCSYIHAIYGLLVQNSAHKVLTIGCGGGTLATMLEKTSRDVTAVDIDPASFFIARKYFKLPATVACHKADGEAFLRCASTSYDAIVIDAYHGHRIPAHLESREFFDLARARLSADGSVLINVHLLDDFDQHADQVADCMEYVWDEVRILDSEGAFDRNAIVMGGAVNRFRGPEVMVPPAANARLIERELLSMRFRRCRLNASRDSK